jgi:hypothetical protein
VRQDAPASGPQLIPVQELDAGDHDTIIVRPIGDVHCGNPYQDTVYLKALIREIKDTPNMYWIGCGDYIESNLKRQKHAGVYFDLMTPKEQVDEFVSLFDPIADRCLGMIGGNHDHRVLHDTSFDPARMIAKELGLEDKYRDDGLVIRLAFGKRTQRNGRRGSGGGMNCKYIFYVTHGATGSALVSGKSLSLQRASDVCPTADVVIGAHVHTEIAFKELVYLPSFWDRHECAYKERICVNTGSLVKMGAYARTARYRPTTVGVPSIHLETRREKVSVTI